MDTNHSSKISAFPEAPASWNTRYIDSLGFECQITLRGETGSELLEKAANALRYLLENGCVPLVYTRNGNRQSETKPEERVIEQADSNKDNADWCPIHQCAMKRWEKDGRVWYSHKMDGSWCRGK